MRHVYLHLFLAFNWILFRCETTASAGDYLVAMFGLGAPAQACDVALTPHPELWLVIPAAVAFSLPLRHVLERWSTHRLGDVASLLSAVFHLALLLMAASQLAANTWSTFVYFRF